MQKQRRLIIAYFFIQGIAHNIGHPVTPAFVRSLLIPDHMFGVFFASMSLGMMIGGPIWGILSDRGRKRNYIFLGLIIYSLGQFSFGYFHHQTAMIFFRFISGIGAAAGATLLISHLIETTEPHQRAYALAFAAAATTLGASLGYYIGGFISTNTWMVEVLKINTYPKVFLTQALVNGLYAFFLFFTFKEAPQNTTEKPKETFISHLKDITKIDKSLLIFLISLTLITIGATNLSKYVDVYFDELGYTPQDLGTFVFVTGIVSVFASLFIVPIFTRFKNQIKTIAVIQLFNAAIVLYVFRASNFLLVIYTIYMIYIIFKAVYLPLEQNYISSHATEGKYGKVIGIRQAFLAIGMVLGPLIGGFVYERSALLLFDTSAYIFILGVLLLGLVRYYDKKKKTESILNDSQSEQ